MYGCHISAKSIHWVPLDMIAQNRSNSPENSSVSLQTLLDCSCILGEVELHLDYGECIHFSMYPLLTSFTVVLQ